MRVVHAPPPATEQVACVPRADLFAMPQHRPDVVVRPRVAERLTAATGRDAVVCAPAGYGKTTQVSVWAECDGRPVAWIDLEACDNDPAMLLPLLVEALRGVTDIELSGLPGVVMSRTQVSTRVAPVLGRAVARTTVPFVLVLDDIHVIDEAASLDLIDVVAGHLPPQSTMVLVGRGVPMLPMARLRVLSGVVDVGSADLALDVDAAAELLAALGVELTDEQIEHLVEATEGWPVGVRMMGLAARDAGDARDDVLAGAVGHERAIADFVVEEWLRGVAAADVDFLMRVSGFDHLDAPMCDWVLERSDSGERLERLHRRRSAVIPLDRRGGSYRMHALLREVFDESFAQRDRRGRRAVDLRCSEWFERHGEIDRAVQHALRAGDTARAEALVTEHAVAYQTSGRYATVHRWLGAFSNAEVMASPPLCLAAAVTALGMGDDEAAVSWIRCGLQTLSSGTDLAIDPMVEHRLRASRSVLSTGTVRDALVDAEIAYHALPPGIWHALACEALGVHSFAIGDTDRAADLLDEGANEARLAGAATFEAICRAHTAVIRLDAGDRQGAASAARRARLVMSSHHLDEVPTLILVSAMSALVEALDGHLDLARAELGLTRRNMAYVSAVSGWANVQARIALAQASLLMSDRIGAQVFIDEANGYLRGQPDATAPRRQLAVLEGQLKSARTVVPLGPSSLTTAELKVLHYLPTNLNVGEIAQRLFVSRNTAKSHAAAVYRKLGASSRGEAVAAARCAGLLPPSVDDS